MIKNITEVSEYTKIDASRRPIGYYDQWLKKFDSPNIDKRLFEFKLPDEYVKFVGTYNVVGVFIGYFSLSLSESSNLYESIVFENSDVNPFLNELQRAELIQVAREESDPICVGREGAGHQGELFFVDVMNAQVPKISSIAPDFENYVLLTANLNDLSRRFEDRPQLAISKMNDICLTLELNPEQCDFWVKRAEWYT